jgi:hypothetical protein
MNTLDHHRLLEWLDYDPATGVFTRKAGQGRWCAGQVCGWANGNGYLRITLGRQRFYSHRLAWFYVHGEWPQYIDHINGDRTDNRIANLRPATKSQNAANGKRHADNKSGAKGVSWDESSKKWLAQISVEGRYQRIGLFRRVEDAHAAYVRAAKEHFGEFARVA